MEGEVRLNNLYLPQTIEDYYQYPFQFSNLLIKDQLPRGKVEVCVAEQWGTVCEGDSWNNKAASVICSQLGFSRWGMLFKNVDSSRYIYIIIWFILVAIIIMFMYHYVYVYVLLLLCICLCIIMLLLYNHTCTSLLRGIGWEY